MRRTGGSIPACGRCRMEKRAIASRCVTRRPLTSPPDQIHELGVKSVAEIEAQMLAIAKAQGFSDLKSFNEHIRQDPKLHAKSGQQLFDLYTHYRDQMYAKLPELFGRLAEK